MRKLLHPFSSQFSVIDRYMLTDFVLHLSAITGVLWLIYASTRFARYLAMVAVGKLPVDVVFILLGFNSLGALAILLPIAAFLAMMLSLGRMNADNELTVMAACGISRARIMRNVVIFAGITAIVVAYLSLMLVPDIMSKRYEIEKRAKMAADTTGLLAGSFKEGPRGNWTFYSEGLSKDKQSMENIFIELTVKEKPITFRAERGHLEIDGKTENKFIVLENGYRYEGGAGEQDFTIAQFKTHSLLIEKGGQAEFNEKHKALPTEELLARGGPQDLAQIQWRISTAVMTLILCLMALPLANAGPRKGRFTGFVPAVLIYIIYSNLLGVNQAWLAREIVPFWIGSLWVHMLMVVVMLALLYPHKWQRFMPQMKWVN